MLCCQHFCEQPVAATVCNRQTLELPHHVSDRHWNCQKLGTPSGYTDSCWTGWEQAGSKEARQNGISCTKMTAWRYSTLCQDTSDAAPCHDMPAGPAESPPGLYLKAQCHEKVVLPSTTLSLQSCPPCPRALRELYMLLGPCIQHTASQHTRQRPQNSRQNVITTTTTTPCHSLCSNQPSTSQGLLEGRGCSCCCASPLQSTGLSGADSPSCWC